MRRLRSYVQSLPRMSSQKRRKMQVELKTVETQTDNDYEAWESQNWDPDYDDDMYDIYGSPCPPREPTQEEKARRERREKCTSYVSGKGQ